MKKIWIILLALGFVTAASAQGHRGGGGYRGGGYYRGGGTRVIVSTPLYYGMGYGLGYGFGSPYFGMGYGYGYPYYGYNNYAPRPSELDMQVADIKHEYQQKIDAARDDDSISGKERRATVKELKREREEAINQARRDFYKSK